MVDVEVIGAGGGSIARVDTAGGLTVGPDSAGADPGPIAYGRGGTAPTVTDANLALGRLDQSALLGGDFPIDAEGARTGVLNHIGKPLGLSAALAAHGIIRVVAANIARTVRAIATQRGHELERFTLMAYGGAGPLLAAEVAKVAGLRRILVPVSPGTLCASAMLVSDVSMDFSHSLLGLADDTGWALVLERIAAMAEQATAWLVAEQIPPERRRLERVIEARYLGQNFELAVPIEHGDLDLAEFRRRFETIHRREYGYVIEAGPIEVVTLRTRAVGLIEAPAPGHSRPPATMPPEAAGERPMFIDQDQGWQTVPVHHRPALAPGQVITGPAIIEEMSSTTVLLPEQRATVDAAANLVIDT